MSKRSGISSSKVNIGGVEITRSDMKTAFEILCDAALSTGNNEQHFHLICASSVYYSETKHGLSEIYSQSTANFADGKSVVIASKLLGEKGIHQVRGPELFTYTIDNGRSHGLFHYFIGATSTVLNNLIETFHHDYPGAKISGIYSPPFRQLSDEELANLAREIVQSKANLVWLGISTPAQDFEASRLAKLTGLPVVCVGAAFDFAAGIQKKLQNLSDKLGLNGFGDYVPTQNDYGNDIYSEIWSSSAQW